jgi:aminoglycoside/choline kinase family phosphotransferase
MQPDNDKTWLNFGAIPLNTVNDPRADLLAEWLSDQTGAPDVKLETVSGDASFRRYFRFYHQGRALIAVDAPPAQEDSLPFVNIARAYLVAGIRVPRLYHLDLQHGFMCLEDFGDNLLLAQLNEQTATAFYTAALSVLPEVMQVTNVAGHPLPPFDKALLQREIDLFTNWLLERHLQLSLSEKETQILNNVFTQLIDNALAQPQVGVHRDYHSRNLMVLENGELGIIDFQDAVVGPITYDAVSLLRDCYIQWPDDFVYSSLEDFRNQLVEDNLLRQVDEHQFRRWFDLMGMQRHIKASGIFCRLNYRDGKSGYLADVPRTVGYIAAVGRQYEAFLPFVAFLEQRVLPALAERTQ